MKIEVVMTKEEADAVIQEAVQEAVADGQAALSKDSDGSIRVSTVLSQEDVMWGVCDQLGIEHDKTKVESVTILPDGGMGMLLVKAGK